LWQAPTNFGIDKDTSKCMFLLWFMVLKFPTEPARKVMGTSEPPH
jgi:hypothetical protein